MTDPIVKTIELPCSAAKAFEVFVHKTMTWWPLDTHSVSAGAGEISQGMEIEPKIGGAVFEIMFDGSRAEWGVVTKYEPGKAMAMTWNPGGSSHRDTLVEVTFEDLPNARSKVTLTHFEWENLGDKADEMRAGYNQGWVIVFETCFAAAIT